MSYTKTDAIGRLVADPEMKNVNTQRGDMVIAEFRLAVNIRKDETVFYNCTAFARSAEIIRDYVKKGQQVFVSGTFRIEQYESNKYSDENGKKAMMYSSNLNVNQVVLLSNQGGGQQQSQGNTGGYNQQQSQGNTGGYNQQQQQKPQQQYSQPQQQQQQQQNQGGGFVPQQNQQQQNAFAGFQNFSEDDLPF